MKKRLLISAVLTCAVAATLGFNIAQRSAPADSAETIRLTISSVIKYNSTVEIGGVVEREQFGTGVFDSEGRYYRFIGAHFFKPGTIYNLRYSPSALDATWNDLLMAAEVH